MKRNIPRDGESLYTVYRTSNLLNGRYYIGVHKTEDPNDAYLGSGKLLLLAVEKHGASNFRKEILYIFDSLKEAYSKEEELVAIALKDPDCYNLKRGGEGGWDYAKKIFLAKLKDPDYRSSYSKKISIATKRLGKKLSEEHLAILRRINSRPLSEETKLKIGKASLGRVISAEARKAISDARLNNPLTFTPEMLKKMSEANKHPKSEETKEKMRKAAAQRDKTTYKGKKKTEEDKAKLSELAKQQPREGNRFVVVK